VPSLSHKAAEGRQSLAFSSTFLDLSATSFFLYQEAAANLDDLEPLVSVFMLEF